MLPCLDAAGGTDNEQEDVSMVGVRCDGDWDWEERGGSGREESAGECLAAKVDARGGTDKGH